MIPAAYTALTGLTTGHDLPKADQKWVKAALGVLRQKMIDDEETIQRLTDELKELHENLSR